MFHVSGSDETPVPEVMKLRFFLFTMYLLVELIHNSTNAKEEEKIGQVNALKKERQCFFCHFRNTKKNRKKIEDFLFLPIYL